MRACGVIVAGGRSSRMGREKVFQMVAGRTILDRIITRLGGQVSTVAINANGGAGRFKATGLFVFSDIRRDAQTPLAGLHAALSFATAHGFDAVLTVPSDAPFLPPDLFSRLAGLERRAAIAASGGQAHYLTGLWSSDLLHDVDHALAQPRIPRLQDWAKQCGAAVVEWPATPYDPFFNVNTQQELAEAERIAAEFGL
jgi:molybdopterin-guanine dinucleotide biosynthesis protein A